MREVDYGYAYANKDNRLGLEGGHDYCRMVYKV